MRRVSPASAQGATCSGARHHRHREVPAQGQGRAHRRRMWSGQDLYGAGHDPCAGRRAAQHHAGDVPLAHHAQVGARGPADHTACPRPSSSRTCATAAIPAKPHGVCEVKLQQRQDGLRGQASQPGRNAAHGPQGVAEALPGADLLHYRQGQRQARLLLGARLSQGKVRSESRRRRQSGFRRCHSRLRDAEAHRARLSRQAQGLGDADSPRGGTTRFSALWQADRDADSAHGADRVHRPLHARAGSTSPLPTNCTSWPATRRRATASACSDARRRA